MRLDGVETFCIPAETRGMRTREGDVRVQRYVTNRPIRSQDPKCVPISGDVVNVKSSALGA